MWKKLAPLAAASILAACQATATPTSVIDTSCLAMEPMTYSRKDSALTTLQIRQHNAAWRALCGK